MCSRNGEERPPLVYPSLVVGSPSLRRGSLHALTATSHVPTDVVCPYPPPRLHSTDPFGLPPLGCLPGDCDVPQMGQGAVEGRDPSRRQKGNLCRYDSRPWIVIQRSPLPLPRTVTHSDVYCGTWGRVSRAGSDTLVLLPSVKSCGTIVPFQCWSRIPESGRDTVDL